ncbi:hypothetical protein E2C01_049271 [Portunus trituberculatus]|uniref:Uncharacterized protein n=1 Tax=Portunus trituberculatus TaxID=210409 RepID=A0A5B7GDS9_PORTR|nr:hypothetical protein [Portunus trituberculatus]
MEIFSTCYQETQVSCRKSNQGNGRRHGSGCNDCPAKNHHHLASLCAWWRLQQLLSPTNIIGS